MGHGGGQDVGGHGGGQHVRGLHGGGLQIWNLYGEEQHVLREQGDVGRHVLRGRGDVGQDVGEHGVGQHGGEQDGVGQHGEGQDGVGRGVHIRGQDEGHDKHQVFQDE